MNIFLLCPWEREVFAKIQFTDQRIQFTFLKGTGWGTPGQDSTLTYSNLTLKILPENIQPKRYTGDMNNSDSKWLKFLQVFTSFTIRNWTEGLVLQLLPLPSVANFHLYQC